jgi:hypothetical protein
MSLPHILASKTQIYHLSHTLGLSKNTPSFYIPSLSVSTSICSNHIMCLASIIHSSSAICFLPSYCIITYNIRLLIHRTPRHRARYLFLHTLHRRKPHRGDSQKGSAWLHTRLQARLGWNSFRRARYVSRRPPVAHNIQGAETRGKGARAPHAAMETHKRK